MLEYKVLNLELCHIASSRKPKLFVKDLFNEYWGIVDRYKKNNINQESAEYKALSDIKYRYSF